MDRSSDIYLSGDAFFFGNVANDGGAIYITRESNTSRSAETFVGNAANRGRAIYVVDGSTVGWSGRTEFVSSKATLDVGVYEQFNVFWSSKIMATSNTAKGNG